MTQLEIFGLWAAAMIIAFAAPALAYRLGRAAGECTWRRLFAQRFTRDFFSSRDSRLHSGTSDEEAVTMAEPASGNGERELAG